VEKLKEALAFKQVSKDSVIKVDSTMDEKEEKPTHKSYRLKMKSRLPLEFESKSVGAISVDDDTFALPNQIFKSFKFHLLYAKENPVGRSTAYSLEYLIRIHGGKMSCIVNSSTIVIAAHDSAAVQDYFTHSQGNIYMPSLVYDHVADEMCLNKESLMGHVYLNCK